MSAIKVVLILGIAFLLWAFRNRTRVGLRAGARLLILSLAVLAVASIIDPAITQAAADLLGVTRGTDLLLYLLILVFAATMTGMYFRFRDLERRLAGIVRAAAIREAVASQGMPDGSAVERVA
jgi:small membrane protein